MCVIVYKPEGNKMPSIEDLQKCFVSNPDGAGFMLPINNKVVISKGFMTFNAFKSALTQTITKNKVDPVNTPIIMHFRISTQGGVNQELCHPFPVCESYEDMRQLDSACDIGLAHNGIITLTSESDWSGGHYDYKTKTWVCGEKRKLDHNDTMKFIKDYLSLIVGNDLYWSKDNAKIALVERLIGYSKLAIMNRKGYVKLIGDFYKRDGAYYSNLNAFPKENANNIFKAFDEEYF